MSDFQFSSMENIQVISLKGMITEEGNRQILETVESQLEQGKRSWVVDLSKLEYMSSIGINLLLGLMVRSQNKGGKIAIASPSSQVLQLLDMTRLTTVFQLCPSVKAASTVFAAK